MLGRWTGNPGDAGRGRVAFARKQVDGWTSVYVGTAPLTAELLRRLAADAGASLWSTRPDVVNATRGAAVVVATEPGRRTLHLPRPMRPVDTRTAPQTRFELDLELGEVRLFASA